VSGLVFVLLSGLVFVLLSGLVFVLLSGLVSCSLSIQVRNCQQNSRDQTCQEYPFDTHTFDVLLKGMKM
jgi:hypothetical protein